MAKRRTKSGATPARQDGLGFSRREMIKLSAGALVAAPLTSAPPQRALQFFTRAEYRLVDELTELIIPADEHSPGARAAGVAAYIDRRLAEAFTDEPRQVWRAGLKRIEALSQELHGRPFLQTTTAQRIALLTRISQQEMNPQKPEEIFFKELKARTVRAYYTSKIGIHTEMEYKGNRYLKEFVGFDAT